MKDYAIHSLSSILSSLRTLLTSPKRVENGYGITRIPAEFAKLQVRRCWLGSTIYKGEWNSRLIFAERKATSPQSS